MICFEHGEGMILEAPLDVNADRWDLPFFLDEHRQLAQALNAWAQAQTVDERDERFACLDWVTRLARDGWLKYCVTRAHGGQLEHLDSRSLVIIREILSQYSPLADFAFAMQGLGSGPITLGGSAQQQSDYLRGVCSGHKIAAFALSEEGAGSDVAGMTCSAVPNADGFLLNGEKTWISNGGIANFYVIFCKTDAALGSRGISAFIVDAKTPGLDDSTHLQVMAPHPLATIKLNQCQVPSSALLGSWNGGFKLAMQTLDIFRASVAGAALGMARRALFEALSYAKNRQMFNQRLVDFQLTQVKLGQMKALIESAALLTYQAAWMRDTQLHNLDLKTPEGKTQHQRYTQAAAMAKWTATENAQQVIDMSLQMHGGKGVLVGQKIESLYRDIRALRIYEGATEVQQLIVGKALMS
jgi:acyl-CoA dehydrogenase